MGNCIKKITQEEQPLLSDFLKELKDYKKGILLDHHVHIFYNDWSLNPYDDDDYSERVSIIHATKLRNLNNTDYQNYKVLWWDRSIYVQAYIEICVKKSGRMKTVTLTDDQIDILEDILLLHLEDESNNDSLSRDEEYINDLKRIYNAIVANRFEVEE